MLPRQESVSSAMSGNDQREMIRHFTPTARDVTDIGRSNFMREDSRPRSRPEAEQFSVVEVSREIPDVWARCGSALLRPSPRAMRR